MTNCPQDGIKCSCAERDVCLPNPSITVGTQVRLTGVVTGADGSGNLTVVLGEDFEVWIHPNKIPLEVIRQPFKRGVKGLQGLPEEFRRLAAEADSYVEEDVALAYRTAAQMLEEKLNG